MLRSTLPPNIAVIDENFGRAPQAVADYQKYLAGAPTGQYAAASKDRLKALAANPRVALTIADSLTSMSFSSPGRRPVQLLFDRVNGNPLRLDAGAEFRVELTRDLEQKLSRWLVTEKPGH